MLNHRAEVMHERGIRSEPVNLSPKSRRRAEFTIKQLQSGVVGRARSTITSITDIWKSKVDTKGNKITSPAAARRTLDIMNVWSRQRRSASATRAPAAPESKNDASSFRNSRSGRDEFSYTNVNCLDGDNGPKKLTEKHHSTAEVHPRENASQLPSHQSMKNKYLSRFSRNKSFEIDDLWFDRKSRTKPSEPAEWCLSEGELNNLNVSKKKSAHKSLLISQSDEDVELVRPICRENGKVINLRATGNKQSIVKARLKFQKVKASDDIVLNRTTEPLRPRKLTRQHSEVPLLRVSSFDDEQIERAPTIFKSSSNVDGGAQKPRKKLSFREPIICGTKGEKYRSKYRNAAEPKPEPVNFDALNEVELEVKHETELDQFTSTTLNNSLEQFQLNWRFPSLCSHRQCASYEQSAKHSKCVTNSVFKKIPHKMPTNNRSHNANCPTDAQAPSTSATTRKRKKVI